MEFHRCNECGNSWEKEDEWISVKDRLPEKAGSYLIHPIIDCGVDVIHANYEELKRGTGRKWYIATYLSQWGIDFNECHPTHWQPLPSPPSVNPAH